MSKNNIFHKNDYLCPIFLGIFLMFFTTLIKNIPETYGVIAKEIGNYYLIILITITLSVSLINYIYQKQKLCKIMTVVETAIISTVLFLIM